MMHEAPLASHERPVKGKAWPVATMTVLTLTAGFTGVQFMHPPLLNALCRDWRALSDGEWWRLLTPLLVHDEGWRQMAVNLSAIAVLGVFVERTYGPWRWLLFYLTAGLAGEVAGYAWQPIGAGASVAAAGLLGALLVWLVARPGLPWMARAGGIAGLAAAGGMTLMHDLHGPPILVGAVLAALTGNLTPGRLPRRTAN